MAAETGSDDAARKGESGDEAERREAIELEPAVRAETPRYVIHEDPAAGPGPRVAPEPVPSRPLHLCPGCDYILSGLTSRRCPECGGPFTLSEARCRARDTSPAMQRLLLWSIAEWWAGLAGVVLLVVAFVMPNVLQRGARGVSFNLSFGGWAMLYGIVPLVILGWALHLALDARWPRVLFILGILAMFASVFITFL